MTRDSDSATPHGDMSKSPEVTKGHQRSCGGLTGGALAVRVEVGEHRTRGLGGSQQPCADQTLALGGPHDLDLGERLEVRHQLVLGVL